MSPEEFELRVAAREAADATVLQAEAAVDAAQLQLSYTEIRAPIAGQINRTQATRGNLVGQSEGAVLTTIVSMDLLYVYFDVPERDLVEYQKTVGSAGQAGVLSQTLVVEIGVETEEGYPHAGKIDFRENRVDMGTGTVRIRGRIPNPKVPPSGARLLYPGLFARVRAPAGPPRSLPAIPEDALMTGQEGRFVYVLGDKDTVQKRTVQVGAYVAKGLPAEGGPPAWTLTKASAKAPAGNAPAAPVAVPSVVSIESGLAPTDRVIINGLTKARPGGQVAPEEWELKPPSARPAAPASVPPAATAPVGSRPASAAPSSPAAK
jgi:multidrug efflux system membrane fusion protein